AEIGAVCREFGALFHTDAAQAAGKIPLDVERMGLDLLSISAHKYYGPKGVGVLYVRRRGTPVRLAPLSLGGGQEAGLRPGTLNVPGIVGLGECSRLAADELDSEPPRLARLRDRLLARVRAGVPDVRVNGPPLETPDVLEKRLAGNLSLSFPGLDGTALVISLKDIAASSGSACTTGNAEPSYVLKALGVSDALATATLRLCVGRFQKEEEIDYAARRIVETAGKLRLEPH
ncbi:MAG: aminotransferase class V-fold PLP-dependent enzyme, partial [Planctomycetota bacterium]|nr:aminotransferase class V-fold PLP-dependent enzyme [Planctomycetota bacterium]